MMLIFRVHPPDLSWSLVVDGYGQRSAWLESKISSEPEFFLLLWQSGSEYYLL